MISGSSLSLLFLPALTLAAPSFKAFKNSKCTDPLSVTSMNTTIPNNELIIDTAIANWNGTAGPAGHWYPNLSFQGANLAGTLNGTGSNNVYWKVPKADDTCTFVLMKQKHDKAAGWKTLTPLPGQVALLARDEGCYYTAVNRCELTTLEDFEGLITSFCCGDGDCAAVHMGANLFITPNAPAEKEKRSPLSLTAAASRTVRNAAPREVDDLPWSPATDIPASKFYNGGIYAIARRSFWHHIVNIFKPSAPAAPSPPPVPSQPPPPPPPPPAPTTPSCKIVGDPKKVGVTTGKQRIVTDPQSCDTGPGTCSHTVSVSFQASTALSHSNSASWTVTGGMTVGVSAGVDFIAEGSVKTDLSMSLAHAWTEDTGTTVTTGWSNTTSQQIVQQVGTHAFLSFTPFYVCWKGDASCGNDDAGNEILIKGMDFCQPSLKEGGSEVVGEYSVVYMG
ncbi:uncharacterized protein BDR25DRAFT_319952 [Lindgomyces ingoldianus]|uniref:Uncharacterized protein n=1 Tax=Lindgomyces ingoldianus TaxID=673940 RepID=A0ACB6Q951_9PLEO|nr:uncharacterized protein BDR25DRAFT_319952 [Lindgomyces ingoldianus]KAF2463427.1 hypothetical protein BDR25DRAFT_319952 [Lindgomyces ingoldianus]